MTTDPIIKAALEKRVAELVKRPINTSQPLPEARSEIQQLKDEKEK